ncbi:MAG: helix-turn-helix domain-containing protein [Nitrospira sp.]
MSRREQPRLEQWTVKDYEELAPPQSLVPFVDRFWHGLVSATSPFRDFTIVPDGCVDVVYEQLGPHVRCLIFGTVSHIHQFQFTPDAQYIGIRFRPGMGRHFLDLQLRELTDQHIELPTFLGVQPDELTEESGFLAQTEFLTHRLGAVLHRLDITPTPLDRALYSVQQNQEVWRVDTLSELTGHSIRHVERTIMTHIGLPPKFLLRILRVQSAIAAIHHAPLCSLVELAATLGYSDQAHMNRDFRLLTGSTPAQYQLALAPKA